MRDGEWSNQTLGSRKIRKRLAFCERFFASQRLEFSAKQSRSLNVFRPWRPMPGSRSFCEAT